MDSSAAPKFLFLVLLSSPIVCCSSGVIVSPIKDIDHELINSPTTTLTRNSVTTPVTATIPPDTSSPGIVTVTPTPTTTPISVSPTTPATNPTTNPGPGQPGSTPATNPTTNPPAPVTNNPGPGQPVTTSPPTTPTGGGQSWCVAKSGAPEKGIQVALDFACGIGGADCSAIQQGASCYNPNTLQNHASYAFNSYYQKNPVQTSCDFGGVAVITNANPSSGSCTFTTRSSSASPAITNPSPTTMTPSPTTATPTPTTTTPTPSTSSSGAAPTGSSSGAPPSPNMLNSSNPVFGLGGAPTGFGESPPITNTASVSMSTSIVQPFICCIIMVTSIVTGGIIVLGI